MRKPSLVCFWTDCCSKQEKQNLPINISSQCVDLPGAAQSPAGNLLEKTISVVFDGCPRMTWSFLSKHNIAALCVVDNTILCVRRLKSLGEGCKVWSSSAPNLGKSPKHAPMTAGFSSLNEMGESFLFFN